MEVRLETESGPQQDSRSIITCSLPPCQMFSINLNGRFLNGRIRQIQDGYFP